MATPDVTSWLGDSVRVLAEALLSPRSEASAASCTAPSLTLSPTLPCSSPSVASSFATCMPSYRAPSWPPCSEEEVRLLREELWFLKDKCGGLQLENGRLQRELREAQCELSDAARVSWRLHLGEQRGAVLAEEECSRAGLQGAEARGRDTLLDAHRRAAAQLQRQAAACCTVQRCLRAARCREALGAQRAVLLAEFRSGVGQLVGGERTGRAEVNDEEAERRAGLAETEKVRRPSPRWYTEDDDELELDALLLRQQPGGGPDAAAGSAHAAPVPACGPLLCPHYTVVLDLDETLIQARGFYKIPRPGVSALLYVLQQAEIVVWTAGGADHAAACIRELGMEQRVQQIVSRDDSTWHTHPTASPKPICLLGRNTEYVLAVDNHEWVVAPNPANSVVVPDFFGAPEDCALFDLASALSGLCTSGLTVPQYLQSATGLRRDEQGHFVLAGAHGASSTTPPPGSPAAAAASGGGADLVESATSSAARRPCGERASTPGPTPTADRPVVLQSGRSRTPPPPPRPAEW